ncbi:hypothetical protein HBH70_183690 [Parastagonospora nodorum]|nr:hypothetical protein HBH70_183690 [Parastagonospora nodorum]KAH5719842.1 hypothetical protein HBI18_158960 [Parastagonospora nodorum]KAH6538856.1 hypothetical protein HBI07_117000 [Parastagonospora nodorum]
MPLLLVMSAHASPNHRGRPADAACRAVVPRLSSLSQQRSAPASLGLSPSSPHPRRTPLPKAVRSGPQQGQHAPT